jgi:SAM-dependent methyltransferase
VSHAEKSAAIVAAFPGDSYIAYMAPRYAFLLDLVERRLQRREGRILDIGPTNLTGMLYEQSRLPVDSLGFEPDSTLPRGRHYHFDLNDAQWPDRWRTDLPMYDLVVMAEVIEHVHTSPRLVLSFLRTLMRPGAVLILQTPNAARLGARIKLLRGRHPYQLISENVSQPGHHREYTAQELHAYATGVGFDVDACFFKSYFDLRYSDHDLRVHRSARMGALLNTVYGHMPPRLRMGITMVLRNRI